MTNPASTTTPQQSLEDALRRVADTTAEIKAAAAKLDFDADADRVLAQLLSRREAEFGAVGRLVFAWTLTGREVRLQEPAPAVVDPPPPPATPPATVTRLPKPAPLCEIVAAPTPAPRAPLPPPPSVPPRLIMPVLPDQDEQVRKIMATLPPPSNPTTTDAFDVVARKLIAALGNTDAWVPLTSDVQQMLVGYCACFARHLQGVESSLRAYPLDEVQQAFPPLSSFSRTYRPGFVKGLMRDHIPQLGSWLADAQQWWSNLEAEAPPVAPEPAMTAGKALALLVEAAESGDESATLRALYAAIEAGAKPASNTRVLRVLTRYPGMLQADPSFKSLRKAIRDQVDEDAAGNAESSPVAADEDTDESAPADLWPHRHINAGKRAIIVGGSRRPEVADRIRATFGFAEVEWIDFEPRRTAALAEQIRAGSVHTLFLLSRFINHGHQDILSPACRDAKATFVLVSRGYGLSAVRAALEKAHGLS